MMIMTLLGKIAAVGVGIHQLCDDDDDDVDVDDDDIDDYNERDDDKESSGDWIVESNLPGGREVGSS